MFQIGDRRVRNAKVGCAKTVSQTFRQTPSVSKRLPNYDSLLAALKTVIGDYKQYLEFPRGALFDMERS
jgi:hypothetical protein